MDEKHLIRKIQDGDAQAIDELISQLYPQIYSYVYVRMRGKDCSKDITQEVFLQFIKHIDQFEFKGKTKHYLLRIAVNCCNGWYRNHARIQEQGDLEDIPMEESKQDINDLRKILHRLPPQQEEVLVLKYYEELKIREIADILGLSQNTVKTRLRLGISKLKQIMKKEDWL